MPHLGVLGSNFEKLFSCLKSAPRILFIAKLFAKIMILKLGMKMPENFSTGSVFSKVRGPPFLKVQV